MTQKKVFLLKWGSKVFLAEVLSFLYIENEAENPFYGTQNTGSASSAYARLMD